MPKRKSPQLSNGSLKLISLGIALLLELYFYSQDNSVTQMVSAVLEFQNVPQNRIIVDPPHAEQGIPAHLEVYGPKSIVEQIAGGFHTLKVPFPENAPFSFGVDVPYDTLRFPPSVSIIGAKPARVNVKSVELVRKEVPVELQFEGKLPAGHLLGEVQFFPRSVIIRGPFNELQKIEKVVPEPINLNGLIEPLRAELLVKAPGEFSALNVNLISLDLQVIEKPTERQFDSVVIHFNAGDGILPEIFSFTPDKGIIWVKGPQSLLDKVDSSQFSLSMSSQDAKAMSSGGFTARKVPLQARAPAGLEIVSFEPKEVMVSTRKKQVNKVK